MKLKRSIVAATLVVVGLMAPGLRATGAPITGSSAGTKCVKGRAADFTCKKVDLLSFTPLAEIGGGRASDIWGWADPETGNEYALMGSTVGLQIINVTDPTQPVYLGTVPKPDGTMIWQDVEVYKDHAFVVCDLAPCGMQVLDLTRLRGVEADQVWTPDLVFPLTGITHTIDIDQESGFAYLNGADGDGGARIVDISDPLIPKPAGVNRDDGYTHDSHCRIYRGPDKRYKKKEICFNANEDTITIYDMTDKTAPARLARIGYDGARYTHQAWLTMKHTHILVSDELDEQDLGFPSTTFIFDVRKLDKPKLLSPYIAKTMAIDHNNYVLGDLVFQANYTAGLRILDASKVASGKLREIGYFDFMPDNDQPVFDGAWAVYPYLPSGNVIMSGMGQGLFVVRPRL